jgi:hypothetical protein
VPTLLQVDVTSSLPSSSPGKQVPGPELKGREAKWMCHMEPLPVGPKTNNWEWGVTMFGLCPPFLASSVPSQQALPPTCHAVVESRSLSLGTEVSPRATQPLAEDTGWLFFSFSDPWSFCSVIQGWRSDAKGIVWDKSVMIVSNIIAQQLRDPYLK